MITFPPSKINIGLRILRRRSDGYHDIQTLFYPIPLTDTLEIIPSERGMIYDLGSTWTEQEKPEDNLVVKAYNLLSKEVSLPAVEIVLRKRIPTGAGLGGGSADAAHTLRLLLELFNVQIPKERLMSIARELGADVPFFLLNGSHIGEGVGEQLTPYPLDLTGYYLTLIFPKIHIATPVAYAGVTPSESGDDLRSILQRDVHTWQGQLTNDFEPSIFSRFPELRQLKSQLYSAGAIYASMSGSGSTFYALSQTMLNFDKIDYSYKTFLL